MNKEHLPYITIEVVKWQLLKDGEPFGATHYADTESDAMAQARALVNTYAPRYPEAEWGMRWK